MEELMQKIRAAKAASLQATLAADKAGADYHTARVAAEAAEEDVRCAWTALKDHVEREVNRPRLDMKMAGSPTLAPDGTVEALETLGKVSKSINEREGLTAPAARGREFI